MKENYLNTQSSLAMKGAGYYSAKTAGAKTAIDKTLKVIENALETIPSTEILKFADYGSADGGTSQEMWFNVIKLIREKGDKFLIRIFTDNEIRYCESKGPNKYQHYAGRFAAKESIIKAVKSSGYKNPIPFKDIEILPSDSGAPIVGLHFVLEGECKVSISHTESHATASALYIQK